MLAGGKRLSSFRPAEQHETFYVRLRTDRQTGILALQAAYPTFLIFWWGFWVLP